MMLENKKRRKPRKIKAFGVACGVSARIRTGGLGLRRLALYPAELRRHLAICGYLYSTHLPPFCQRREVEQTLRRIRYPAEVQAHAGHSNAMLPETGGRRLAPKNKHRHSQPGGISILHGLAVFVNRRRRILGHHLWYFPPF